MGGRARRRRGAPRLGALAADTADLPESLLTHCGHGQRAMTAASLLRRAGRVSAAVTSAGPDQLATMVGAGL